MAKGIVYLFEVVKIKIQEADQVFLTLGVQERLTDPVEKEPAVGKSGKGIEIGKELQVFLCQLARGDIPEDRLYGQFSIQEKRG
jgi:hypothetical protein